MFIKSKYAWLDSFRGSALATFSCFLFQFFLFSSLLLRYLNEREIIPTESRELFEQSE